MIYTFTIIRMRKSVTHVIWFFVHLLWARSSEKKLAEAMEMQNTGEKQQFS